MRVLISFLGTAQPKEREYRVANYRFQDGTEYTDKFVAKSLYQYYDIDRLILVGTAKSMWEEVYREFAEQNGLFDTNIYDEIGEFCIDANAQTPPQLPFCDKIETALGKDSKAVVIKYGLNEQELQYNVAKILGIEQYLNRGDELYVDITHSFRSLPLYLLNLLIYLQNVSQKQIKIQHISYGMLDVTAELGYTPVIELNNLLLLNQWITGAYAFSQFGNAYQIADLIEQEGNSSAAMVLRRFSDEINLNYFAGVKNQVQQLSSIKSEKFSAIGNIIVPATVEEHRKALDAKDMAVFQYNIARWQADHKNYGSAYMTLLEALISYVCEGIGIDNSMESAGIAKDILKDKIPNEYKQSVRKVKYIAECQTAYSTINHNRNLLAHPSLKDKFATKCILFVSNLLNTIDMLEPVFREKERSVVR